MFGQLETIPHCSEVIEDAAENVTVEACGMEFAQYPLGARGRGGFARWRCEGSEDFQYGPGRGKMTEGSNDDN